VSQLRAPVQAELILMVLVVYHTLIALVVEFGAMHKFNVCVLKQVYGTETRAFRAMMVSYMDLGDVFVQMELIIMEVIVFI
jgi:hypothetical protein